MNLAEKIGELTRELERKRQPINKTECFEIFKLATDIEKIAAPMYRISELLKELERIKGLMACYLPKATFYDAYGGRGIADVGWNYNNMDRERKKLIASLRKLRSELEVMENENRS
jgi:hypothetical protein